MTLNTIYENVPLDEKAGHFLSDDDAASHDALLESGYSISRPSHSKQRVLMWTIDGIILLLSSLLFTISLSTNPEPTTEQFVRKFSSYSPAAGAVSYQSIKFNGSMGAMSEYVGASPAVDTAWNRITFDIGDQMITEEELSQIDKPNTVLQVTDPKTGREGYRIGLEVFHQLHCLNLLRKVTFREYYEPLGGDLADEPAKLRGHLNHCIEMLRMNLMCESDIGVITFSEQPGMEGIWPDFSTHHTCRNFEQIRDWAVENTVATDDVF